MKKFLILFIALAAILLITGTCYANDDLKTIDAKFKTDVLDAKLPVLVDFWAPWCGPCRTIAPTIDKLAKEYKGKMIIKKMNVDDNKLTPQRYKVQGIPCLIFFRDGKEVKRLVGARSYEELKSEIEKVLNMK